MKRTLLGLVAVAALGATLVSTGAFVDTVDNTSEKIEMEPSDGPNAVYAVENSDGEIELDLSASNQHLAGDGINEGSLTEIPNIFTVNYSTAADEPAAEVWFTTDAGEGIEFVVGTDSVTSIDGNDSKRTLPPDEKLHIGVIVDTRGEHDVESVSEFTIHVDPSVTQASVSEEDGDSTGDSDSEEDSTGDDDSEEDSTGDDGSEDEQTNQDGGDTESEDDGESDPEQNDGESDGNETTDDTEQDIGNGDDGGEQPDDGGGLQTAGQQPTFPGPEETLGGFISGSFLWLIVAVLVGSGLFAATRYGTDRFWGGA